MNSKTQMKVMVLAVAGAFGAPLHAAEGAVFTGEATAKLYSFDYFKGAGTNSTQFLERYNYQQGMGGDQRGGSYLDLDLSIVGRNAQRNVFELERQGFGAHNHRGTVKANSDTLGFSGYYTNFRSATGGLSFRYNPNAVAGGTDPTYVNANSGYVALFNNDSPGQTLYKIDRTTYGLGLALKPLLFGNSLAAAINYDGYKRDGNRFASYVTGGGDITGAITTRWRGFDLPIDERMNRYTVSLNGAPGGFNLGYEGSIEKFDNKARNFGMADFASATFLLSAGGRTRPLHFVPDSTLVSNNFRFAKNYGSTAVAAGYGLSILEADSFAQIQQTNGYNTGKITTNSAYLNVTSNAVAGVGLEGFVKYNNRDNDSTFPAVGLLNAAANQQLGVRIDKIRSLNYGISATFRPTALKSTVTAGWKREDKDRNLTWSTAAAGGSIQPQRSLYKDNTVSDELYVNWIARPMPGVILRVIPSYVWANETGMVTEPEKAFNLKTKLSYAAANGMLVSGYYNHKENKNANNAFFNNIAASVATTSITQDLDKTQEAAGISLNLPVSEWINTHASLSWMQDDFASYYLSSDRRRFEPGVGNATTLNFLTRDRSTYKIDTYVLNLGGDWQVSDELRWNGGYTWSRSKGNVASGLVLSELPTIDGTISSAVHSLNLGVDYQLKKNVKLKASYVYDYNKDDSYAALTGGYHTLMMGVGFGF
ncbi:MAG: MtrB/PioB family outer membrane beta-barrel protein [Sulfuritalea sp.]|nr:MtrB/PioB family outer membrane beta-barrel protein [Sulfuritalea sp.]